MFNYDGVRSSQYTAPRQILANVEFQYSVGCVVAQAVGTNVTANGVTRKIAKAGTPITISLANLQTPVTHGNSGNNAVLLHDVDVTDGNKNGTALLFGFVNINRLDTDVKALVTAGTKVGDVQVLNV